MCNFLSAIVIVFIGISEVVKGRSSSHRVNAGSKWVASRRCYIVKFNGYYDAGIRQRYLKEAFDHSSINCTLWQCLDAERSRVTQFSDFSVVEVADTIELDSVRSNGKLTSLKSSDHIAGVYPNRMWLGSALSSVKESSLLEEIAGSRRLTDVSADSGVQTRKLLRALPQRSLVDLTEAEKLWRMGVTGKGVSVAVFDTGLLDDQPSFLNVKKKLDWTSDSGAFDEVGHGTFVAGLISGRHSNCPGLAPDADLHVYRVFTNSQVSYTSWFLDAFNFAIMENIDVINLSIGGPDFMDQPFIEKVLELTANGVTFVSAIGNEGPLYGTLNNPGDQMDVLGVGAINYDEQVARFSARGMTTWELPGGYGRLKPDIVTYGTRVSGPGLNGGCRVLSGTSVASPVVTGAVALLMSAVKDRYKPNPAIIKQALLASARRLQSSANMFEQGHGAMNLLGATKILLNYSPQASLSPAYLDMTECPYMWPYCSHPLFFTSSPLIVNITVLNGMDVYGTISSPPVWVPYANENGRHLSVSFDYAKELWPYSGWLAVYLMANDDWDGVAAGRVELKIRSGYQESDVVFPIKARLVRTPPREKRLLWDQFHSLRYPPGYFPRDNLKIKKDPLDWNGDHIHTNFRDLYQYLRSSGYYIDVLGTPFTCVDASLYSALLIVDPEEEFFREEIQKLREEVDRNGLNLIVFGDWFNVPVMKKIRFYDENTKLWWQPMSGGSNVPALNRLLANWNISLGASVLDGEFELGKRKLYFACGTNITNFPDGSLLISKMVNDHASEILTNKSSHVNAFLLGIMPRKIGGGISVFGDSSCLDSSHAQADCFWLLEAVLNYFADGQLPPELALEASFNRSLNTEMDPVIYDDSGFAQHSRVISGIDINGTLIYEPLPECPRLKLATPRFTNVTSDSRIGGLRLLGLPETLELPPYLDEGIRFSTLPTDHHMESTLSRGLGRLQALCTLPTVAVLLFLIFMVRNRRMLYIQMRQLRLHAAASFPQMDTVRLPLRKSLENNLVQSYLKLTPPKVAPNFFDLLPSKYQFTDVPGYEEFCAAFDLEYEQKRLDDARELYESACELGHPLANYCYGLWFMDGDRDGTTKDLRKAFQKFCLAHKHGLGFATYQLADYYRTGKGKVVARDVKKCFGFLLQSVLDPRIHLLLDAIPFCMLGLAYGLGRGPPTSSLTDAARWLDRACHYVAYQQHIGSGVIQTNDLLDREIPFVLQLCMLVLQLDQDEAKRQVTHRLDAMEKYMEELPPAHSMKALVEFALLAKTFGLDYDEYLSSLSGGKEGRRITWKSFRRQTDGRARPLYSYEKQSEIEHWPPMEPDELEVRNFIADLEVRCNNRNAELAAEEDFGFHVYPSDFDDADAGAKETDEHGQPMDFESSNCYGEDLCRAILGDEVNENGKQVTIIESVDETGE